MFTRRLRSMAFIFTVGAMSLAVTPALAKNPRTLRLSQQPNARPVLDLIPLGSGVLIVGGDGEAETILRTSDGTVEGTKAFARFPAAGDPVGEAAFLGTIGTTAFLQDLGNTLWQTSGTLASTKRVGAIPHVGWLEGSLASGLIVFTSTDTGGSDPPLDLVRSDGTKEGTYRIPGGARAHFIPTFIEGNDLLFIGSAGGLKRTDGTTVTDVAPTPSDANSIARCGGVTYVAAPGGIARVDGGKLTTLRSMFARALICAGSRVVFQGEDASSGLEPWVSDGTEAGTKLLRDIRPGSPSGLPSGGFEASRRVIGDRVFFEAHTATGNEPWVTDGTEAGTARIGDSEGNAHSFLLGVIDKVTYYRTSFGAIYALDDGSKTARLVTAGGPTPSAYISCVAGGKLFATSVDLLWVYDPALPIDPGDKAPEDIPFTVPPLVDEGDGTDAGPSHDGGSPGGDGSAGSGNAANGAASSDDGCSAVAEPRPGLSGMFIVFAIALGAWIRRVGKGVST